MGKGKREKRGYGEALLEELNDLSAVIIDKVFANGIKLGWEELANLVEDMGWSRKSQSRKDEAIA